ncbi:sodium- and chloride-dependent glycine transporter 1-like [Mytilus californianus]|uniref:sodium- and chloride-dependent glycine transporter 1-like n=1 Tax=Mytilus californianus TaxID=6549 RepID=UPI00224760B6|nr:sodium- and chloride-dependent glycine transporter 1-like [Mytilus californianus]
MACSSLSGVPAKVSKQERANWGSQVEFILTCVGFAVGLGNVWRFPYLCFKNGGGAFLIPYFICMVIIGIPMFYLELCLGQFCSLGPLKVWRINPLFKGLGLAMIIVSALVAIYYAVIIAYCLYFLVASMQSEVPWKYCDNNWNTCDCRDGNQNESLIDPWNGTRPECLNMTYTHTKSASDEYFNHKVLEKTSGMDDMQGVKWNLTLCNLFVWLLTFIVLSRGIKSLGKVVYFSAIFPYILLTALLIRGLLLEGHMEGINFYLTPDWSKLSEASVWSDAAVQIFYSLGTCQGGLIAMASYNQFKNNTLRDSLLIPVINCLTSFYAGFVIFSVLGFMAHKKNTSVDQVVDEGPGLAFVVYPEALAQMPISPLWAVLFFIMMMTLGFSSLFSITETVITGLVDQMGDFVEKSSRRLYIFRFCICAIFFLLGLPMTTKGGMYILNLLDKSVGGFPLLVVGFVELLVIIYIYGYLRLKSDIEMMLGRGIPVTIGFFYFAPTWCFIAPIALLVVIVLKALQWKPYTLDDYVYPDWATALSWLIVAFPIVFIPAWILYYCACRDKRNLCHPKANWGPAFEENRTGIYSKDLTSFYQSPVASTVLENDGYKFVRKDTNEVNKTNIYQPYSDPPVMANFESRTDSSYDNKSYVHDVLESTKL